MKTQAKAGSGLFDKAPVVTVKKGSCIGCANCSGMCMELIDAATVPEIVLGRSAVRD